MDNAYLHHASVTTREVTQAVPFYTDVLGFKVVAWPAFTTGGASSIWDPLKCMFVCSQCRFTAHHFVGSGDIHFSIRAGDFQAVILIEINAALKS